MTVNNVNTEDQGHSQLEDTQEIHIRNPNYKGKNYDPNYQARKAENKQQEQLTMTNNQYKAPATRPPANHNNDLARSSDIAGGGNPKNNRGWVPAVKDERAHQKCCSLEGERSHNLDRSFRIFI